MLTRDAILARIPHAGRSCLLDAAQTWSDDAIHCTARSHLDPANPLRHAGRLHPVCGAEYGMQAAALHGALREGRATQGWLAALRGVAFHTARLDDAAHGVLQVRAWLESADAAGLIYRFALHAEGGQDRPGALLVDGRGTVIRRGAP